MNKDSIIGMLLIGVLFVGYFFYTKPSEEQMAEMKRKAQAERDSITAIVEQRNNVIAQEVENISAVSQDTIADAQVSDSLQTIENQRFGIFSKAAVGTNEYFTIENDVMQLKLSAKGGAPADVLLKKFKTYTQEEIHLFKKDSSEFILSFFADNQMISSNQLYFRPVNGLGNLDATNGEKKLTLRLEASVGKYIDFVYTLKPGSYSVDFDIVITGLERELAANRNYLTLDWMMYTPQQEKGAKNENQYSQIYYKYYQDETGYLSNMSDEEEDLKTKVQWIAFKDQFFSSIFIAKDYFTNAQIKSTPVFEEIPGYIKKYEASIGIPYSSTSVQTIPFQFYFGPNDYNILREISQPDEKTDWQIDVINDLGWGIFGWINKHVIIFIFNFLSSFMSSYGLIILLMTIIIKLFLFPLTYKSYMSTAKMKVLKPQIDEINAKIPKEKTMERQQATMALYKKAGVNPMGGCLPMVLQMPILFAMFRFFPVSIELRQQSFLWADDLSSYDSILDLPFTIPFYGDHVSLFTLLMTASTIIYTKMQNSMNPQNNAMPGMQTMMYMMPLMFLFFLNSYSSGLTYYYFVANVFTFSQMFLIKYFVDDKKVLAKLEAAKKKPVKKKSSFQSRLEDMAKQKQQQQKRK